MNCFLNKLNILVKSCTEAYNNYEYCPLQNLKQRNSFGECFVIIILEIVKKRIYENKKGKRKLSYALYSGLLTLLKLIAPIMPFITEEIYSDSF